MGRKKAKGDWAPFEGDLGKPKPPVKTDRHHRPIPDSPALDIPVKQFYSSINQEVLELALGEHDKYAGFLASLHSPDYTRHSFAAKMRAFNITLHELNILYQDTNRNIGLFGMADKLPKIMEDVAEDAQSRQVSCPRCDGEGELPTGEDEEGIPTFKICPECSGTRKIRQVGDKHSRDLVFESMKLTGVKGPMVAIQQNFGAGVGGAGLDSGLEETLRMTQTITMGERKVEEE